MHKTMYLTTLAASRRKNPNNILLDDGKTNIDADPAIAPLIATGHQAALAAALSPYSTE